MSSKMRRDWHNFSSLVMRELHGTMFGPRHQIRTELMDLAMKIIRGETRFTAEELQLQQNEPEKLESLLREIREFLERKQ